MFDRSLVITGALAWCLLLGAVLGAQGAHYENTQRYGNGWREALLICNGE